jgi:hypothetical protein
VTSKQPKRRHHTVPRFHLRRFADDRGQLTRVELPGTKRHPISVNDATVEKDFYTIELSDGSSTDRFEDRLGEIEGLAARATSDLVDNGTWPIPVETRQGIAVWAALQFLRSPANRRAGNEAADLALKLEIAAGGRDRMRKVLEEIEGRPATDAEVEEWWAEMTDFDSYHVVNHPNAHIKQIGRLLPGTFAQFCHRGWTIVRFIRKAMITTDTPVALLRGPNDASDSPVGLETAGGILVPLDRRVALLMTEVGAQDLQLTGFTALANSFNQRLADGARRVIFHHPADDPLRGLKLPKPRRQELHAPDPAELLRQSAPDDE